MSDLNQRDDLEEFRRRLMENAITDPEEATAIIRKLAVSGPPILLELIYDEISKTFILQGNQAGLNHLIETVKRLARPDEAVGAHAHFHEGHNLTRSDLHLVIQRVADDGSGGAHGIAKDDA